MTRTRSGTVLVTGGAGFIGANLCAALAGDDGIDEVVALDDLSTGRRENLDLASVKLIEGDILDAGALDASMAGASCVVHLAARPSVPRSLEDPGATNRVNVDGTLAVLEAVRRHHVEHVIVASSSSVYGTNPALPKSEQLVPMPASPYAASKLAAEAYALSYANSFGTRPLVFRLFNVFGPLQSVGHAYAAVVPTFIDAALAGIPLPVDGDGGQTRDFTFVGSVVAVLVDAVERQLSHPGPVNLAFGTRVSLLELITVIESVLGHPVERVHRPPRAGDVRDSQADQSLLRSLFPGVEPDDLRSAIAATVDWYRQSR
jgi:UDP-glucose 4-epimerase